jgi:DNA helicase HerA-like ATPase
VVNGERGIVSDISFGINLDDIKNHALIAGVTGSGKTTTLMRMLSEAVKIERNIIDPPTKDRPYPIERQVQASILALDWMRNMRNLASIPDLTTSGRFRFYSLIKPELGAFKWNPMEVPAEGMTAAEWLNAQADNFTASFNLGEYGRSLIAEFLTDLFQANRLEPFILRPEIVDEYSGAILRQAVVLPSIPREQIPDTGIGAGPDGRQVANAFTYAPLTRCISMAHLATLVATKIELLADPGAKRLYGNEMSNRLQSLWRRMQYFAPGGQYEGMLSCDPDLDTRNCLGVTDLIDPDRGLVTVLETDGLDIEARRLVLGSVLLAIYRYGLHYGNGIFDHDGRGPGCFVVMEESHELFGEAGRNEDAYSAATRTALYESMFRRVRALGLRLVAVAQEPSKLPESVTANINNVFLHKVRAKEDRDKAFSLLNWSNMIGQNMREWRYLGEMPIGYCIARLDAREDYIESAPVQFRTDPPMLSDVTDAEIIALKRS